MADIVNVGNSPDDGTGDKLRDAFIKINDAFDNIPEQLTEDEVASINKANLPSGINPMATMVDIPTDFGVQSVKGDGVDETDPKNLFVRFPTPEEIDVYRKGEVYNKEDVNVMFDNIPEQLTEDEVISINKANLPSGNNPMATMGDIPTDLGVQTVKGDGVDNRDPKNPFVRFPTPEEIGVYTKERVDIMFGELPTDFGVETITGDGVDNTDPKNPFVRFPKPDEIDDLGDYVLDEIGVFEENHIKDLTSKPEKYKTGSEVKVLDASQDPTISFPIGASTIAFYKKLDSYNGDLTDWQLISAPYGITTIIEVSDVNKLQNVLDDKVDSDTTNEPTGSDKVLNIVSLTQAEYDAGTSNTNTIYIITDA